MQFGPARLNTLRARALALVLGRLTHHHRVGLPGWHGRSKGVIMCAQRRHVCDRSAPTRPPPPGGLTPPHPTSPHTNTHVLSLRRVAPTQGSLCMLPRLVCASSAACAPACRSACPRRRRRCWKRSRRALRGNTSRLLTPHHELHPAPPPPAGCSYSAPDHRCILLPAL